MMRALPVAAGTPVLATLTLLLLVAPAPAAEPTIYRGMCDASAAVALGPDHFVVGDDEHNVLQIYRRGQPDPAGHVPLQSFLGTKKDKESDIEGAATIGSRIYWITSHGTNSDGEVQDRRRRLFATDIVDGATPTVKTAGKRYDLLVDDLAGLPTYKLGDAALIAPKKPNGLSIEGLAEGPGGTLYVGFRNPIPGKQALIVPIRNPAALIDRENDDVRAELGEPIELDLDGLGIRSLERDGDGYLIVAGPIDENGTSVLRRWSGAKGAKPTPVAGADFTGLNPEALFLIPNSTKLQILSDDGKVGGKKCPTDQFRSVIIER
ncbi:DUF3616 domain-containing protein [Bradyrhizobium sp. 44]|uniref:DUF3616 domain-containing protein n=1 Tax=Bradyrhizobium sp. 44 TaxID=2782675 RepID=UPI001FFB7D13|nr:DUF3616 domain-containing protein [Bradyrhizobium sp. 44]MCK1285411.1 DUF3616 domain-containing protein [Bradyrhizobium sp. 44]